MSQFGMLMPPPYGSSLPQRNIVICVLDNAIAVECDGAINVFKNVSEAVPHLEAAVKAKNAKIKAALRPVASGGFPIFGGSEKEISDFVSGISRGLGIPQGVIKEKIASMLGVEPWQGGGETQDEDDHDGRQS